MRHSRFRNDSVNEHGQIQKSIWTERSRFQFETRGAVALRYFPSSGALRIDRVYNKLLLQKNQILTKNISIETWSKEFIPIALEIYKFESRHSESINWTFSHVQPINNPISGTQLEIFPSQKHYEILYCHFRLR